jgi:hypothetical protein
MLRGDGLLFHSIVTSAHLSVYKDYTKYRTPCNCYLLNVFCFHLPGAYHS